LITKTIGKPCKIQAIPPETALNQLILSEKNRSNHRIAALEANLNGLVEDLKIEPQLEEDAHFTLLTTIESIRNRADLSIRALKKEAKISANKELMLGPLSNMNEIIDVLIEKSIRVCVLVTPAENMAPVLKTIEKIKYNKSKIATKAITKSSLKNFIILDRKEVWIAIEQKTESGFPCMLWTNDRSIVQVYEENFDMNWNNSGSATVYSTGLKKGKTILA
jgi:hypothetical protein